jgi:hypothetical protein
MSGREMMRLDLLIVAAASALATAAILAPQADASHPSCWDARGPAPVYPDTEQALDAAPTSFAAMQLLWNGRELRNQRLAEDDRVFRACVASR